MPTPGVEAPGRLSRREERADRESIGDDNTKVVFKHTGEVGLQQLGYSLNGDQFTISIQTARGPLDILLTRQSAH